MRGMFVIILSVCLMLTGCAKKSTEAPVAGNKIAARKLLVEGTVYLKQGDVKGAVGSFASAIKIAPEEFEPYFMLSETFVHLKQFDQAISVLSMATRQFPENGLAYYLLAVAHEGAAQVLPAIVAARRSVEIFSTNGDQDGARRSAVLLSALVEAAKQKSEEAATANAASDAQKASVSEGVAASPDQALSAEVK